MGFRNHNKVPSNILLHRRADYAASRSASERERKTLRGEAARALLVTDPPDAEKAIDADEEATCRGRRRARCLSTFLASIEMGVTPAAVHMHRKLGDAK
jgi:hypothetical protein